MALIHVKLARGGIALVKDKQGNGGNASVENSGARNFAEDQTISVRTIRGDVSLLKSDIVFIKSAGNYVEIHTKDKEYVARGTLTHFSDLLQSPPFIQIHRSYLLNSVHAKQMNPCSAGLAEIVLGDGSVLPVSRKRKHHVASRLSSDLGGK